MQDGTPPQPIRSRTRFFIIPFIAAVTIISPFPRFLGCTLPIELWMLPKESPDDSMREYLARQGVAVRTPLELSDPGTIRVMGSSGFTFKATSIMLSSFDEVMMLDADINPTSDPTELFDLPQYKSTGLVMWKDYWRQRPEDFGLARLAFNLTEAELRSWVGGNSGSYPNAYREEPPPPLKRAFMEFEYTNQRVHAEHHAA